MRGAGSGMKKRKRRKSRRREMAILSKETYLPKSYISKRMFVPSVHFFYYAVEILH